MHIVTICSSKVKAKMETHARIVFSWSKYRGKIISNKMASTKNIVSHITNTVFKFFLIFIRGVESMRQLNLLGSARSVYTNFWRSLDYITVGTKSIARRFCLSTQFLGAPRIKRERTNLVCLTISTCLIAMCKGVLPSLSWSSNTKTQLKR